MRSIERTFSDKEYLTPAMKFSFPFFSFKHDFHANFAPTCSIMLSSFKKSEHIAIRWRKLKLKSTFPSSSFLPELRD
ncbi:hypothetical protein MHU86_18682 [Fragilaria crotonensis]|nr:hypothetical protein MHU86_18677 [Fragilaria crotonensis]KAI2495850.1 hypothetical protein MHU86_18682 [Fragilaria crotonensis]